MYCPHCNDEFTLFQIVKNWFWLKIPDSVWAWRYKTIEDTELKKLKEVYYLSADLTNREHFVCFNRTEGKSLDEVAKAMNVTRERVRQIQSKALRKLTRTAK